MDEANASHFGYSRLLFTASQWSHTTEVSSTDGSFTFSAAAEHVLLESSSAISASAILGPLSASIPPSATNSKIPATDATLSGATSSSQGTEASNQLLGKRKIQDLVSQVDPQAKLAPEVEDLLLEFADDFIDTVTTYACTYAKHRKSSTLDAKDVILHLEKNLKLIIPGYSSEQRRQQRDMSTPGNMHQKRLDIIHKIKDTLSGAHLNNSREMMRQGMGNLPSGGQITRPEPSSDQLIMQSTRSQMLQQVMRNSDNG